MQRDLQIKYIRETYKGIHGNYPHHINLDHMEDDELDKMFAELNEQYEQVQAERQKQYESETVHYTRKKRQLSSFHFTR